MYRGHATMGLVWSKNYYGFHGNYDIAAAFGILNTGAASLLNLILVLSKV